MEARRDFYCSRAEVAKVVAEQDATILVERIPAKIFEHVSFIAVEARPTSVERDAILLMKFVDAVRAMRKRSARSEVVTRLNTFLNDCCVDDGSEGIALGVHECVAGDAENTVSGLCGAPYCGLADRKREQGFLAHCGCDSAGSAAAVGGELIEIGAQVG